MSEEKLNSLKNVDVPEASANARARAMQMAMDAFDETQETKKSSNATQGLAEPVRPTSITSWMKGLFAMENRVPMTAALTGLLLLPVGYLLFQSTALTPPAFELTDSTLSPEIVSTQTLSGESVDDSAEDGALEVATTQLQTRVQPEPAPTPIADEMASPSVTVPSLTVQNSQKLATGGGLAQVEMDTMAIAEAPAPTAYGRVVGNDGVLIQNLPTGAGDQFTQFDDANLKVTVAEPVSTFSIDVDKASYAYVRNALNQGYLPQADAVRVEELINYFDYDYARPESRDQPFATDIEIVPSPWNEGKQLMRIGVQGFELAQEARPAANLVFLIDTSGSMNEADKLPLLIQSFSLMLDALDQNDTVSIAAYAGSAGTVLEPTQASDKRAILHALRGLSAGGSTAGAEGIELAYDLAEQAFKADGVNQVILATDGDFNVGLSNADTLTDYISEKRDDGVFLSVLGFGSGNLNDGIMQALAQNGDGAAYYIDTLREARSILVDDIAQTLVPIARDVKIQVEFNPTQVAEYRLIGYETRELNREDFNNDKVDAGDVGAGASVTAIYELTPVGSDAVLVDPLRYADTEIEAPQVVSDELGYFKLRYKLPDEANSRLIEMPLDPSLMLNSIDAASDDTKFAIAVAAFGQKLRDNAFVSDVTFDDIADLAQSARGKDLDGYRAEFLSLVDIASSLQSLR